jgi:O-antigen ligase
VQTIPARPPRALSLVVIGHAMEVGWLLAAALVPLAIAHQEWMVGWVQMPKVFLLRSCALFLVALATLEWALKEWVPAWRSDGRSLGRAVMDHPARLVYLAAGAVLLANLVSIAFAPVKSIAIGGIDPGWDTYGLFSVASYLAIFTVMATHLRSGAQIRRLLWVVTGTSIVVSAYGIGQHFGYDWARSDPHPVARATLSFGNPIFGPAYLLMTVPLSVALFMPWREKMSADRHIWLGAGIIALQLTAILFTLSRGPWIGLLSGMIVFFGVLAWAQGARSVIRPVLIVLAASFLALGINALPVPGEPGGGDLFVERFTSIGPSIRSGASNRIVMWETAGNAFVTVPWVDTEEFPEIPDLRFKLLRPVVGYGPDMFPYAYPLMGESSYTQEATSHGHNFVVHTALELGLLGVAAYMGLIAVLGIALLRMLRAARRGATPLWFTYLLAGLTAALVGRVIEQIPGKAQVSDLLLSWMLAAVIVALAVMPQDQGPTRRRNGTEEPPRSRRNKQERSVLLRRRAGGTPKPMLRIAVVVVATFAITVFWYQNVATQFAAAFVADDAQRATVAAGDDPSQAQVALELFQEALARSPSDATYRIGLSNVFYGAALGASDAERRMILLNSAYEQTQMILDRNPMDHRAWTRALEVKRELAAYDGALVADAIHDAETLVNLIPGFWQARTALAASFVRLGRFEEALNAVKMAKDRNAMDFEGGHLTLYIEAVALRALGRNEDAIAAAKQSLSIRYSTEAQALIDGLQSAA